MGRRPPAAGRRPPGTPQSRTPEAGDRRTRVHRVSGGGTGATRLSLPDLDSPDDGLVDGATTGIAGMHPEGKELSLRRRGEARREMSQPSDTTVASAQVVPSLDETSKVKSLATPGSRCRKVGGAALTPTLIVPPV